MVAGGAGWFLGWGSEGIGRWVGSLWERYTACKCGVGFARGLWLAIWCAAYVLLLDCPWTTAHCPITAHELPMGCQFSMTVNCPTDHDHVDHVQTCA